MIYYGILLLIEMFRFKITMKISIILILSLYFFIYRAVCFLDIKRKNTFTNLEDIAEDFSEIQD